MIMTRLASGCIMSDLEVIPRNTKHGKLRSLGEIL